MSATKKQILEINAENLNVAQWLAEEQLRRANEIVQAFSHNLPHETHHALVAAVLQAIAVNAKE